MSACKKNSDQVGQSEEHTHIAEGMLVDSSPKKKKELIFSCDFIDVRTGESLGNDPQQVFNKITKDRCSVMKALMLEAITGKKHKAI